MTQLLGMLPGMAQSGMLDQGQDKVTQLRMRAFMTMMDSMTDKVRERRIYFPPLIFSGFSFSARAIREEKENFLSTSS